MRGPLCHARPQASGAAVSLMLMVKMNRERCRSLHLGQLKMTDSRPGQPVPLEVPVRDEIDAMYRQAKQQILTGDPAGGIQLAEAAWAQLPAPKFGWDVSKSFAHSLARFYRNTGDFQSAIQLMTELFESGTVKDHQDAPRFILATIYFEMGDETSAMKWFTEANRISKGRYFREEDSRYLEFFKAHTPKKS